MAFLTTYHTEIKGISACVPKQTVRTSDYRMFSEQEKNMFVKNVGIHERRVAPPHLTTSDLCYFAAEKLIHELQWKKEDINCLIFVSQSPDYFLPATSIILQNRLGLSQNLIAFDINLGCSGYVYGLQVISSLISSGQIKKGLLLVGDKSTLSTHEEDKSTYPLFGDAGSATAIEYTEKNSPVFFNLQTDGSGENAIKILDGGARNSVRPDTFDIKEIEPGVKRSRRHLILNGIDIFNFALKEVSPNINDLLSYSKTEKSDINYFVFHQANKLINESVRKKLKINELEKVPYSIQDFGNTSSASIPLTIVHTLKDKLNTGQHKLLLSGFGVGYSWGSCILNTENIIVCDLIEAE